MSRAKIQRAIEEALAFAGLVVLDETLLTLKRGRSGRAVSSCALAWAELDRFLSTLPGVTLREIRFVGSENWVAIATRSDHALSDRIRWVTGRDVAAVRQHPGASAVHRQAVVPFCPPQPSEERVA